ncbi:hypothetical protein B0J17DRAFT_682187 [Rhizoctonia solani]|nr:hypothetical protein B0J17DRAFT_682187 [Rhizoctonia solani]
MSSFHAGAVASPTIRPPPSTSDGRPQIPIVFSHRPGRWHITLQQESDVIPLICYLANEHPKSICVISHSRSAFPYGDIFETISTYPVVRSGKKQRSDLLGAPSSNLMYAACSNLVFVSPNKHYLVLWPNYVAEHQFTHVYLITSSAQLPTVTSLTGDAFQAHPDSASLNAHGPGSLLHPSREKSRKRLENLSRGTLRNISKWYQPIYPPIYSSKDFVMRVMLRSDL